MSRMTNTERIFILSIFLFFFILNQSNSQLVTTADGVLHGVRMLHLNKQVDVFFGIPYAKPPIGDLRFQYPQPSEPRGPLVLDVNIPPPSCLQPLNLASSPEDYRQLSKDISEDCLYLNVWAPVNRHNVSVLVWMHGGRFFEGSAQLPVYNGQFMAGESDVVVVAVNYRLGPLGFSYLGKDSIPGNMGLMDQVLALKWIKENIVHFGGDPNRVTLFGQDAGAASIGFHLLSPISRDLFDKAILQSGSPTATWSYNDPSTAREQVMKLGKIFGCPATSDQELMTCLKEANPIRLVQSQLMIMADGFPFRPVVDGVFLPETPSSLLESGKFKKTSILHGVVKDEANLQLYRILETSSSDFSISVVQYEVLLRSFLTSVHGNKRRDALTLYYEGATQQGTTATNYRDILGEIRSDVDYKCPALDFGSYFSPYNPTYLYSFNHQISKSPYPAWVGATNSYELEMVFGLPINVSLGFGQPEQQLSWFMMTYWTNFAISGDPNKPVPVKVIWLPYDNTNQSYLSLDAGDNQGNKQGLRHRECLFLNKILPLIPLEYVKTTNQTKGEDPALKCPDLFNLPLPMLSTLNNEREVVKQTVDGNGCKLNQAPSIIAIMVLVFIATGQNARY